MCSSSIVAGWLGRHVTCLMVIVATASWEAHSLSLSLSSPCPVWMIVGVQSWSLSLLLACQQQCLIMTWTSKDYAMEIASLRGASHFHYMHVSQWNEAMCCRHCCHSVLASPIIVSLIADFSLRKALSPSLVWKRTRRWLHWECRVACTITVIVAPLFSLHEEGSGSSGMCCSCCHAVDIQWPHIIVAVSWRESCMGHVAHPVCGTNPRPCGMTKEWVPLSLLSCPRFGSKCATKGLSW